MALTKFHPFLLAVGIGMPGLAAAGALGGPNSLNPGGHAGPVAPNMGIMAMMSAMPPPSLTAIQARTTDAPSCSSNQKKTSFCPLAASSER